MKFIVPFVSTCLLLSPSLAIAETVYTGCAPPSLKSEHHTFYVDPVAGSTSGDGSASRPWKTFSDVVDPANKLISTQGHAGAAFNRGTDTALHPVNPTAPIKAGDVILLKSGDHGSPVLTNMFNSDFITVAAAPGQTPVLHTTTIISSGKWVFQGLKFQAAATAVTGATTVSRAGRGLVTAGPGDWEGKTSDIVFSDNSFSTAESTAGWTDFDWINKPYSPALWQSATCGSVTNNHVYNVLDGIMVAGQDTLVQGNLIEKFSNDGMDITTSNLLIKNNTITGGVNTTADPLHADGIQGWSTIVNGAPVPNTNVVIDGNTVLKTGPTATTTLMGIDLFDGIWNGLKIQNNVVVTNHWHGIAVYGAAGAAIVNNTVLASDPIGHPTWITINPRKDGTHSSNVVVRNNISQTLVIADTGVAYDHNIAAGRITVLVGGTSTAYGSGTVGTANTIVPSIVSGFQTVNNTTGAYDLRLRSTSPAIGFGSATLAPALDIVGKARQAPIDAGAYVH